MTRDLHSQVVSGIAAAIVLADASGEVLYNNEPALRIFGRDLTGSRLDPENLQDAPPAAAPIADSFQRQQADPEAGAGLIVTSEDDGVRYYWVTITPVDPRSAAASPRLVMVQDISDSLTGSPALRRIFSQVNHDLRSPLTSITGAAELLSSGRVGELEGVQKRLVGIIEDGCRKMTDILARAKSRMGSKTIAAAGGGESE